MKAKISFLLLAFFVIIMPFNALSQDFIRALQVAGSGPDFIQGVATDSQGNIIIDGTFKNTADFDPSNNEAILDAGSIYNIFLAKYSPAGEYIWAKQMAIGSPQRIRNDKNDNIYLTGFTVSPLDLDPSEEEAIVNADGKSSLFLAKYNSLGEYTWGFAVQSKNGANITSFDVEIDDIENYVYVVGTCSDTMDFDPSENLFNLVTQNFQDFFVAKYTLDGEFVWVKHLAFQGNGYGYPRSLTIDESGNFYFCGSFSGTLDMDPTDGSYLVSSSDEYSDDAFVAKFNSSGEVQWAFSLGAEGQDISWTIRYFDEKIYAVGSFYGTVDFDPSDATFELTGSEGDDNGFVAVYNIDGSFMKVMGMIGTEEYAGCRVNDFEMDAEGNTYLLGSFYGTIDVDPSSEVHNIIATKSDYDMFLSKYNPQGDFIWAIHTEGDDQEQGYFVRLNSNNQVAAFGFFDENCDFDPSEGSSYLYNKGSHDIYMAWYSTSEGNSIDEYLNSSLIKIVPNPASGDCKLQLETISNTLVAVSIFDLSGREIYVADQIQFSPGLQEILIPSHLLNPGMYLVQAMVQGKQYAQKLVRY
jgi:hypothetical protein